MKKICFFIFFSIVMLLSCKTAPQIIPYEIEGKVGFVDTDMNLITPPKYSLSADISNTSAVVSYEQRETIKAAIVTKDGEIEIQRPFNDFGLLGDDCYFVYYDSNEGKESKQESKIISLVDNTTYSFNDIRIHQGTSSELFNTTNAFGEGPRNNYMNLKGEFLFTDNTFKRAYSFDDEEKIAIVVDENFMYRIIDQNGEYTSDKEWRFLNRAISDGLLYGDRTGEEGYFNKNGELCIEVYASTKENFDMYSFLPAFNSGVVACVQEDNKKYIVPSFGSKTSSNWSLINSKGKIVVQGIEASYISEFSLGIAYIYKNGKFGIINTKGEIIADCVYDRIKLPIHGYARAKKDEIDYLISNTGKVYKCKDFLVQ